MKRFLLPAVLLAASTLPAATLYWDSNDVAAGAGTTTGTWATTGGSSFWSTDDTGTTAPGAWVDGSDVNFASGTNTSLGTVNVSGTVSTNNITVGDAVSALTVTGGTIGFGGALGTISTSALGSTTGRVVNINSNLTGTAGLTVAGNGDRTSDNGGGNSSYLQLGGDNSGLSGGITVTAGLVALSSATGVGSNAITLNGGGLLNAGSSNITLTNAISIGASGGTFRTYSGANTAFTLAGVLSGSGQLLKTDGSGTSGALYISGANNTFTGNLRVGAGAMRLSGAGVLNNSGTYAGTIVLASGATFLFESSAAQIFTGSINGSGAGAGGTLSVASGSTLVWNGTHTTGNLTIAGAGTLSKTSGNTNWGSGNVTTYAMTGGEIRVEGSGTVLGGAGGGEDVWTNNKSALFVGAGATFDGVEGSSAANGGVFVNALNGSGTIKIGYAGSYGNKLTFGVNNGSGTFDGTLADSHTTAGYGNYAKNGTGTQALNGNNTFTGTMAVNAGALRIGHANALGTTAAGTTVASGAALEIYNGITTAAEALTLNGTGNSSGGALRNISGANTYAGAVTLASAARINSDAGTLTISNSVNNGGFGLTVGGAGATTLSGVLSGAGSLTKDGAGTATLSGNNTGFSGAVAVDAGTLSAGHMNGLGSGAVTVNSGGTLALGANAVANTVTVNSGGKLTASTTSLNLGTGSSVVVNSGAALSGTFGAFNSGTSAASTFNVTGGASFTTLSGQGAFAGGLVTVNTAHHVGNSPGAQTFGSGLTYANGAAVTLEFDNLIASAGAAGANWDTITVTGGLTIGTGVNLAWQSYDTVNAVDYTGAAWDTSFSKTLISYDSLSGSFNLPSDITVAGQGAWHLTQDASSVVATWTAVPEPSTYGLLGAGALAAVAFVRRRRKVKVA